MVLLDTRILGMEGYLKQWIVTVAHGHSLDVLCSIVNSFGSFSDQILRKEQIENTFGTVEFAEEL